MVLYMSEIKYQLHTGYELLFIWDWELIYVPQLLVPKADNSMIPLPFEIIKTGPCQLIPVQPVDL
jgi:hypothetical protein